MAQLDIWSEMMALERRFDDFLRELIGEKARISLPALPTGIRRPFIPTTDVLTQDGKVVIKLDLPGIDPDKDVKVTASKDKLIVTGERKRTEEIKEDDYFRMETSHGSFERVFPLINDVRETDVKAEYRDGVLSITIPAPNAMAEKKARQIPITTAKTDKAA